MREFGVALAGLGLTAAVIAAGDAFPYFLALTQH